MTQMEFSADEWFGITDQFETIAEEDIQHTYSGRGMFGAQCLGVVGGLEHYSELLLSVDKTCGRDVALDLARAARSDNMGRDAIYYFPGFTVEPSAR